MILYLIDDGNAGSTGMADNVEQVWQHVEYLGKIGFLDPENVVVAWAEMKNVCDLCPQKGKCAECGGKHGKQAQSA